MRWHCGPMVKTLDYGARDSRFETRWGQSFFFFFYLASLSPLPLNKRNVQETK